MTSHIEHRLGVPVVHDGPGHHCGDPGYCGGCWWEQIGQYLPPTNELRHTGDCPGCKRRQVPNAA